MRVFVTPVASDSTNCSSPPGFSVHGILQAGILEWIAIPFPIGSSRPRDSTLVSYIAGRFFYPLSYREVLILCISNARWIFSALRQVMMDATILKFPFFFKGWFGDFRASISQLLLRGGQSDGSAPTLVRLGASALLVQAPPLRAVWGRGASRRGGPPA